MNTGFAAAEPPVPLSHASLRALKLAACFVRITAMNSSITSLDDEVAPYPLNLPKPASIT